MNIHISKLFGALNKIRSLIDSFYSNYSMNDTQDFSTSPVTLNFRENFFNTK